MKCLMPKNFEILKTGAAKKRHQDGTGHSLAPEFSWGGELDQNG